MMDQRNIAIAAVVVLVAAIVGYYYFTTETPAPKKEGTSQNQYYATDSREIRKYRQSAHVTVNAGEILGERYSRLARFDLG